MKGKRTYLVGVLITSVECCITPLSLSLRPKSGILWVSTALSWGQISVFFGCQEKVQGRWKAC